MVKPTAYLIPEIRRIIERFNEINVSAAVENLDLRYGKIEVRF
ncbi:hypothetical protein [uncultured Duncaniella sp.]|nr:hypothetical protein [uncultured Duncaniella sp.]